MVDGKVEAGSLLKYDPPVLVKESKAKKGKGKGKKGAADPAGKEDEGADEGAVEVSTESVLRKIMPPRTWMEDGQMWQQLVSSQPATRMDVINLQELQDQKLQKQHARETGICPVRERIYAESFDELIRQVTISGAERGLLLLRCRDELRMTIASYQTSYESSIAYGMRKVLRAERRRLDAARELEETNFAIKDLERQVRELKVKYRQIEKQEGERLRELRDDYQDKIAHEVELQNAIKVRVLDMLTPKGKGAH